MTQPDRREPIGATAHVRGRAAAAGPPEPSTGMATQPGAQARLAQLARLALSSGSEVTLRLSGSGHAERGASADSQILLADDGGLPSLVCPKGSPLTAAAGRIAQLDVTAPALADDPGLRAWASDLRPSGPVRVTLTGRLGAARAWRLAPPGQVAVSVHLDSVTVEFRRHRGPLVQQRVSLASYLAAWVDPTAAHAAWLVIHTNSCHQNELRRLAAALAGVPLAQVAAATIGALTADEVQLSWVATDGAHRTRLPFHCRARDPRSLGALLHDRLHYRP